VWGVPRASRLPPVVRPYWLQKVVVYPLRGARIMKDLSRGHTVVTVLTRAGRCERARPRRSVSCSGAGRVAQVDENTSPAGHRLTLRLRRPIPTHGDQDHSMTAKILSVGVLALGVLVLAGCGSSSTTTGDHEAAQAASPQQNTATQQSRPTEPTKPTEAPAVNHSEPGEASMSTDCGGQVHAGSHTSCPFAEKVRSEFSEGEKSDGFPPAQVSAYSPVTNRGYTLQCVLIAERTTAECTTGTALVYFPLPGKELPKPESKEEPPKNESTEEGEDEVGSSSHAGDAKFCEEHTCIGSFTTEPGTVVECSDGTYSHSGGIGGACSHHEGVKRE